MTIDFTFSEILNSLLPKRRSHTEGVITTATRLGEIYGADTQKLGLAALFHDLFREKTLDEINEYIYSFELEEFKDENPMLLHGIIAAKVMESRFDIRDEEILNSVRYHTTGRADMGMLEKIIYVADAIEPGRKYEGVEKLREIAESDIDLACLMVFEHSIEYINSQGATADIKSIEGRDWLLEKIKNIHIKKEKVMNSRELVLAVGKNLEYKKAEDIKIIEIGTRSSFADYFLLASANSERQIGALADQAEEVFAKEDIEPKNIEGKKESGWILMDYGDIIINLLTTEMRERYNIEKIWNDCQVIPVNE